MYTGGVEFFLNNCENHNFESGGLVFLFCCVLFLPIEDRCVLVMVVRGHQKGQLLNATGTFSIPAAQVLFQPPFADLPPPLPPTMGRPKAFVT